MREKIAELINRQSKGDIAYCRRLTDQILSLLIEEIKKVENPYVTEGRHWQIQIKAFEDCRQKILKALKSE